MDVLNQLKVVGRATARLAWDDELGNLEVGVLIPNQATRIGVGLFLDEQQLESELLVNAIDRSRSETVRLKCHTPNMAASFDAQEIESVHCLPDPSVKCQSTADVKRLAGYIARCI